MDPTKSKSRGISCDMSQAAVERRLETVDELRELDARIEPGGTAWPRRQQADRCGNAIFV